jgi:hypothetical protein
MAQCRAQKPPFFQFLRQPLIDAEILAKPRFRQRENAPCLRGFQNPPLCARTLIRLQTASRSCPGSPATLAIPQGMEWVTHLCAPQCDSLISVPEAALEKSIPASERTLRFNPHHRLDQPGPELRFEPRLLKKASC